MKIIYSKNFTRDQWSFLCQKYDVEPFIPQRLEDCPPGCVPAQWVWPTTLEVADTENEQGREDVNREDAIPDRCQ